jgi:squalene-associated FAD-dependent desaturase
VSVGPHVVVVGGGLAGLSAAVAAADAGARVTVLERALRLGGATWSFTRDGLTLDNGQHVFMRCCTGYLGFLERVGSAGKVTIQPRLDVPVARPGGPTARLRRSSLPAPLHLARALATYGHLDAGGRWRAGRVAAALRRLDPDDASLDRQTFGEWLTAHGARAEEVAALWDVVCLPTVNLTAGEASLQLAAKVFRTGLLDHAAAGDLGWSRVPLQELHGDAAARVLTERGADVRLGVKVSAVHVGPSVTAEAVGAAELIDADAVVVAVPHEAAGRLLPEVGGAGAALGRSPIVNVHLLYDRRVLDEPFLAGLDSPVQFVFDRTQSSGAPPGQQCLSISLSAAEEWIGRSRDDLVATFTAAVAELLPAARDAGVVTSVVSREAAATFRGVPGTGAARPSAHTQIPGVFLAGAWTATGWPATMEGAVRSGTAAAAAVAEHLSGIGAIGVAA